MCGDVGVRRVDGDVFVKVVIGEENLGTDCCVGGVDFRDRSRNKRWL